VTDIIIGCIPIVMVVIGNMISRSYPWRPLVLPDPLWAWAIFGCVL